MNPNEKVIVPQDVIFQLDPSGNFIVYNVFTQDTLAASASTLAVLSQLASGKVVREVSRTWAEKLFEVWDIYHFSNQTSPVADPTRRIRDAKDWPSAKSLEISSLLELLEKRHFIVYDCEQYQKIFAPKNSFLDTHHLGNFHQQLGAKLVLDQRIDPSEWWIRQKFNSSYNGLNNTLYKAVQGDFLHSFLKRRFLPGHKIIDLGCGIGYYSKLMAQQGCEVLGVDPNSQYIQIARNEASTKAIFKISKIGNAGDLDWIPSQSADFVFMSDALSFYFVPPNFVSSPAHSKPDITVLFADIKRILKPGGRFISVEPNGIFLFRPWLGESDRPFTVITEYNHPWFNVVQNYSQAIQAFIKGGFTIKEMKDIPVNEEFDSTDSRATNFAKEFPLWCLFELEPYPSSSSTTIV